MSIHRIEKGKYRIRWREGGRNKSTVVNGCLELAKKIETKKKSMRDENRYLDIKREINFRMSALIDRYWEHYGSKKKSQDRKKSVLEGIRSEMGTLFVREVDGIAVDRWYQGLTAVKGLSPGTALRHFNVMHHMMEKASTIWARETGVDRNPSGAVEVFRPDDQRERYLEVQEIQRLKSALDSKMYRQGGKGINETFFKLRVIVLIALTTGMRISEIFGLKWGDVQYREGLIAVRAKLKGARCGTFRWRRNWLMNSDGIRPFSGRIESSPRSRARNGNGNAWMGASRRFWKSPRSRISGSTICATRLQAGT